MIAGWVKSPGWGTESPRTNTGRSSTGTMVKTTPSWSWDAEATYWSPVGPKR
ncbi:hypothetical protein ACIRG5_30830 [Lentzea sp. NPDC102401]|uniref:hypothetical protein n=1 Tax=Lentzea sp. NPDC102401 TaxID=3364128 RepID=UPI003819AE46